MLNLSVVIAQRINDALVEMENSVKLAGSSTTFTHANVTVGKGTRVSVGNIQAGVKLILDGIDALVARARSGSANILSSRSLDIRIQTSAYGGTVDVAPQPLDVRGLNLQSIDLHTSAGRTDALARISRAKMLAGKRLMNLEALQNGLSTPGTLSSALDALGASTSSLRGTLVNLSA